MGAIVVALCVAEIFGMAGFSSFAALLPGFTRDWTLSNTEAGGIGGIYYAGYTAAGPILVSLPHRIGPRRIYLFSTAIRGVPRLRLPPLPGRFLTAPVLP